MAGPATTYEANLALARSAMARYADAPLPHLIGGERVLSASGETFTNHSPIDGMVLGEIAAGDATDIDAAATAAHEAFLDWRSRSGTERKAILHKVADLIVERRHEIAVTECVDTGQTMRFMSAAALRGADNFRFFADQAPSAADGLSLPSADHVNYTTRHPIGPVGVITP
ncbi:MAG: aldehyde dehydrogenase family protein, partial [Actinomycetota bacterium]